MISITTPTFDIAGHVMIDPRPDNSETITRRVNRVATLDGGVAINDGGYTDGDRTLSYTWRTVSKAHTETLSRMVQNYSLLTVATPDGVYSAAPSSFDYGKAESTLTLLVKEKLSE